MDPIAKRTRRSLEPISNRTRSSLALKRKSINETQLSTLKRKSLPSSLDGMVSNVEQATVQQQSNAEEQMNDITGHNVPTNMPSSSLDASSAESASVSTSGVSLTSLQFFPGDRTECILTSGYFKNSKVLYVTAEKQLYRKNKYDAKSRLCFWVCQQCKTRVKTVGDPKVTEPTMCTFADSYTGHNHSTNETKYLKLSKKQVLKDLIDQAEPVADKKVSVCHEIFKQNVTAQEATELGISFSNVSRTLTKNYSKKFPASPKTVTEIQAFFADTSIQNTIGTTLRDSGETATPFFKGAVESDNFSFCVFASDDVMAIIKTKTPDQRRYFLDGTFKVCPKGIFTQLLVIAVDISSQIIPWAFILMSNRQKPTYIAVFRYLDENLLRESYGLKCASIMTDYEVGMVLAFLEVVPDANSSHCIFHFAQANKRNAKKCSELMSFIGSDAIAKRLYYKLLCIPLLPAASIRMAFALLKTHIEIYQEQQGQSGAFNRYLDYYENQWINGKESPETISVFGLVHRTNNGLESLNALMGSQILPNATLSRFYMGLRKIEKDKTFDAKLAVDTGGSSKSKKKTKCRARDTFIFEANQALQSGAIDAEEFLNRLTSQHDHHHFCDFLEQNDSLAELEINDIDHVDKLVVLESSHEKKLCQLCCANEPNVVFNCRCQLMCEDCFKKWAHSATSRIDPYKDIVLNESGEIVLSNENPFKCCFCRQPITNYIVARF